MRVLAQKQNVPLQQRPLQAPGLNANAAVVAQPPPAGAYWQPTFGAGREPRADADDSDAQAFQQGNPGRNPSRDFSRIAVHTTPRPILQAKLMVNSPGDVYEQEADRVAEQVMRTPGPGVQRSCSCGGTCDDCKKHQEIQRLPLKSISSGDTEHAEAPASVHEVLRSPGQPLDSAARSFMEPRFGRNFGDVRVHTGPRAAESTKELQARAYTVGSNVVFSENQLSIDSDKGRSLLAHELAHVVQQSSRAMAIQRQPKHDDNDDDEKPKVKGPRQIGLPLLNSSTLCGPGGCVTEDNNPYLVEARKRAEQEKEEAEREASAERYDTLQVIRKTVIEHHGLSKWQIKDLIVEKVDVTGWRILKHYGSDFPGRRTDVDTYRDSVINAIDQYEDALQGHAGQPVERPRTAEDIKAYNERQKKEEISKVQAEGYASSTESFLGAISGGVARWLTSDEKKIAAAAGMGDAVEGVATAAVPLVEARFAEENKSAPLNEPDPIVEKYAPEPAAPMPDPIEHPTSVKKPSSTPKRFEASGAADSRTTGGEKRIVGQGEAQHSSQVLHQPSEPQLTGAGMVAGEQPVVGGKSSAPSLHDLDLARQIETNLLKMQTELQHEVEQTGHVIDNLEDQIDFIKNKAPAKNRQPIVEGQLKRARQRESGENERIDKVGRELAKVRVQIERMREAFAKTQGLKSSVPKLAMGDVKSIRSYRKGVWHISEMEGREKYNTNGNIGIALYDNVTGEVILQVLGTAEPGKARQIIFEEPIGRINIPAGRTPIQIGTDVEESVRDLVRKATGQNFPRKSPSAHGPDLTTP